MYKQLFRYFIPTLISYSTFMLVSVVDAMYIGNFFGSEAQAAINLFMPLVMIISCVTFSINIGANTYFGHGIGAKDDEEANRIFNLALIYGSVMIFVLAIILNIWLDSYLRLFSSSETIIALGKGYGRIALFNMVLQYLNVLLAFFQRTIGNSAFMAKQAIIALIMNIVLNAVFIIGFKSGIEGAALATTFSMLIQLSYILLVMKTRPNKALKFKFVKLDLKMLAKMCINGLSDSIFDVAQAIMLMVNNILIVIYLGDVGLTYMYVLSQLSLIQTNVLFALSDAANPLIATSFGRGEYKQALKYRNVTLRVAAICGVFVYAIMIIFKPVFFKLYGVDGSIAKDIGLISILYLSTILFFSINQVFTAYLTAIGKSKQSLLLGVSRNLIFPLSFTLILAYFFKQYGIWVGYSLGEFVVMIIMIVIALKSKQKVSNL